MIGNGATIAGVMHGARRIGMVLQLFVRSWKLQRSKQRGVHVWLLDVLSASSMVEELRIVVGGALEYCNVRGTFMDIRGARPKISVSQRYVIFVSIISAQPDSSPVINL